MQFNHLMIVFDDLFQYMDFIQSGKWGHSPFGIEVSLPNFARLEARSTIFRRAAAPVPVCGPCRAAVMSGYSPYETGVFFNDDNWFDRLRPEQLWTYCLRRAGYWMGTVGKIFHYYTPQSPAVYAALYDSEPFKVTWYPSTPGGMKDWGGIYGGGFDGHEEQYYDSMVAETTRAFLASRDPAAGCWHWETGFHHPHNPWHAPNRIFESLNVDDIVIPADWPLAWELLPFAEQFVRMWAELGNRTPGQWTPPQIDHWKKSVRNYIAAVIWADEKLGEVLDALEASPFNDTTLITCWSDHGYHLGDKGTWHKFTLWEEACNAPLMFSAPGQRESRTVWDAVSLIDIGPTVCDYLGVDLPSHHRGVSLRPLIEGGTMAPRMVPSFNYGSASGAIGEWRVSVYQDETFEFYNVMSDPWLKDNIALRDPRDPLFLEYRDMLYALCRDWGLDLVSEGVILRGGTPFTSYLGWTPPKTAVTGSLFLMGDVEETARSPNFKRMYQTAAQWRDPDKRVFNIPVGVGFFTLRGYVDQTEVRGHGGDKMVVLNAGARRVVHLGDGNDVLSGEAGNVRGVPGGLIIAYGGRGNDVIAGSLTPSWQPHDSLFGGAGDDTLMGFAGDDYLDGGAGNDLLEGGAGNDTLVASSGQDLLYGGPGDDVLIVTGGSHVLSGGGDSDTFIIRRTGEVQTITDLGVTDRLDLSDWAAIAPLRVTQVGADVHVTAALERIICLKRSVADVRARIGEQSMSKERELQPGEWDAIQRGCTCTVRDGEKPDNDRWGELWLVAGCPLHDADRAGGGGEVLRRGPDGGV